MLLEVGLLLVEKKLQLWDLLKSSLMVGMKS